MANNRFLEAANKWKNKTPPLNESNFSKSYSLEDVLLFSSGNEIFVLNQNNNAIKILEAKNPISSLAFSNDILYHVEKTLERYTPKEDREEWNVVETFLQKSIANRSSKISSLCSNEGKLYDLCGSEVFDTLNDKKISSNVDWNNFGALFSHNKKLYVVAGTSIYSVLDNQKIFSKENIRITGGGSYKDKIYFSTPFSVESIEDKDHFWLLDSQISKNLCNYLGDLVLTTSNLEKSEIYNASLQKPIYTTSQAISSLCVVPKKYLIEKGVSL